MKFGTGELSVCVEHMGEGKMCVCVCVCVCVVCMHACMHACMHEFM